MRVESLIHRIRDLLSPARDTHRQTPVDEGLNKLLSVLEPHGQHTVDDFAALLAKVKKPEKTPAQIEAEQKAKEAQKREAARLKAEEKRAKQEADARAKAEAKVEADQEKKRKAEAAAHERAAAKLQAAEEKKKQQEASERQNREAADKVVRDTIDEFRALLIRFSRGSVPKEAVDQPLDKLKALKAPELLTIARAINADATLTEKSAKSKILKQITEMVRRVWKTSDNVNH